VRHGIVEGEPGMFPWPFGHFYGRLARRWRRHHEEAAREPEPGSAADGTATGRAPNDGGAPADTREAAGPAEPSEG
jgi:hypothetical protein